MVGVRGREPNQATSAGAMVGRTGTGLRGPIRRQFRTHRSAQPESCGAQRCHTPAMPMPELTVIDGEAAGAWIGPRLGGEFGAVSLQVPAGFDAYVRICHPAHDMAGDPVTWSEVARETGRTPHALMQWHAIVGSPDHLNFRGSLWPGSEPERGNLAPEQLEALCSVLAEQTHNADHCFFGLWIGYGWVTGGTTVLILRHVDSPPGPDENRPSPFSGEELSNEGSSCPVASTSCLRAGSVRHCGWATLAV